MKIFIEFTTLAPGTQKFLIDDMIEIVSENNVTRWENGLEIEVTLISQLDKIKKVLIKHGLLQ